MENVKVLIVEDNPLQSRDIASALKKSDYEVVGIARDIQQALRLIDEQEPNFILIDIVLAHGDSGIELAKWISQEKKLPFIYITAQDDKETFEQAKLTRPHGYLVKPYNRDDLYRAIELALFNYVNLSSPEKEEDSVITQDHLFIKDGRSYKKVILTNVQWIEAIGNYKKFYTASQKNSEISATTRMSMEELEHKLIGTSFIRVHKSFIVNIAHLTSAKTDSLSIGQKDIPIGRVYQDKVSKIINKFKSI